LVLSILKEQKLLNKVHIWLKSLCNMHTGGPIPQTIIVWMLFDNFRPFRKKFWAPQHHEWHFHWHTRANRL